MRITTSIKGGKNMIKEKILFCILCIGIVILFQSVSASGIGISPTTITVSDAMRGDINEEIIRVYNPNDDELIFTMEAEGDASEWISFYNYENDKPFSDEAIPPNGEIFVRIKVEIPSDAANGEYNATIYASTKPRDSDSMSGMQAVFRTYCTMTIKVTDIQRLSGTVDYISVRDGEVNLPIPIEIEFTNTGNVATKPVISIDIQKDGATIEQMTIDDKEVKTHTSEVIQTEWDTTGERSGDYTADVSVSLNGEVLKRETLPFELFPVGTLTQEGEFIGITSDGALHPGTLLKVIGTFRNTGEMGTTAKMVGEVVKNGNLINTIESDELLVPTYKSKEITAYLDLTDVGDYVVTAHMIYAGKETDEKELTFTVSEAAEGAEVSGSSGSQGVALPENTRTPLSVIPVVSAVLIAGLCVALWNKER